MANSEPKTTQSNQPQNNGFLGNLLFNIVIPVVLMSYASSDEWLGPAWSIVAALSFPIGYGLWDLKASGKINPFSVLGIISVLLTGGISLLELPAEYIAIKEAAIPALIGIAVIVTQYTNKPLVKILILNEQIINWSHLNAVLAEQGKANEFESKVKMSSYIVASSFFLSAVLNYILAKVILVSPPGTTEYTEELGKMTALSYPVIVIPSMILLITALWYLFSHIKKITGGDIEDFLNQ